VALDEKSKEFNDKKLKRKLKKSSFTRLVLFDWWLASDDQDEVSLCHKPV